MIESGKSNHGTGRRALMRTGFKTKAARGLTLWGTRQSLKILILLVVCAAGTQGCPPPNCFPTCMVQEQACQVQIQELCGGIQTQSPTEMVSIPSGVFWMGCVLQDAYCREEERPGGAVWIDAFDIDITEVTVGQYLAYLCSESMPFVEAESAPIEVYINCNLCYAEQRANHPVTCINMDDAEAYCNWAGKRLCRENEWERAARGACEQQEDACCARSRMFPWGDEFPGYDVDLEPKGSRQMDDADPWTMEVGSISVDQSPDGVLDLASNVSELVRQIECQTPTDMTLEEVQGCYPLGAPVLSCEGSRSQDIGAQDAVLEKGGTRGTHLSRMRVSARDLHEPEYDSGSLGGFRCCR